MGLEEVKNEIEEEAEKEAERILSEAEEEKERILSEAEQEAERIVEQAEEEARKEAEALRKKEVSSARMAAREERLQAREEVMEKAFEQFRERVDGLDEETERELLEDALDRLQGKVEIGTVRTRGELEGLASDYGEFEEADVRGAVIESEDGDRSFDLTFEAAADKTVAEARREVSEVLFG